jgi:hypothetical protein
MKYPIFAGSGADFHMFKERFFDTITPPRSKVPFGDGKTALPIMGIGPVKCSIGGHLLVIDNVRYIPEFNH